MQACDGEAPAGSAWAFEFVWDGLRAMAYLESGRVHLLSGGSDRSITAAYPDLARLAALADTHGDLVLDGKIVAFDDLGRPHAGPLRQRMSTPRPSEALLRRVPVRFYVCDLLYAEGRSTLAMPYRRRRELLAHIDLTGLPADASPYFLDTDGGIMLDVARRHGLPGVVAKRLDSRYHPGRRSRAWVQTVPRQVQQVVVGGWQPGGRSGGEPFGALLVGVTEPAGLRYVGRINAGLDHRACRELSGRLDELVRPNSPFRDLPPESHRFGARWVAPRLVGEVSYRRWETDGRLRHATWLGLASGTHPAVVHGPPPPLPVSEVSRVSEAEVSGVSEERPAKLEGELTALREAVRLAQAEVRALRAQISPHFLYNALTTIAAYVRTNPPRARELLGEFAEYTRYSFRAGTTQTTLGAELANVERYLALEQARFGDRLKVVCRVGTELHDVALPFLTLQPLVENAVRHGIEGTPSGGTVRIVALADGSDCVITVSEDASAGHGMDAQRLGEATEDLRARLAAAGYQPGLGVDAGSDSGSSVTMRIPRAGVAPTTGEPSG